MRYLVANDFYVILDNQFNLDATAKYNPGLWIHWWKQVVTDLRAQQDTTNQVLIDLLNEPDSQNWR